MSEYILEVKNATKRFGGLMANQDISFNVKYGEIVGVVGPNGAGKTTLFNSISGEHTLTSGEIIFDGQDVTKMKAHQICKLGVGRTFQIPKSLDAMTVLENILVGALCRTDDMIEARAKAREVAELCGLTDFIDDLVGSMNVIQKKRVEIARALATEPKLILLDETMAGLTNAERKEAVELIRTAPVLHDTVVDPEAMPDAVRRFLGTAG